MEGREGRAIGGFGETMMTFWEEWLVYMVVVLYFAFIYLTTCQFKTNNTDECLLSKRLSRFALSRSICLPSCSPRPIILVWNLQKSCDPEAKHLNKIPVNSKYLSFLVDEELARCWIFWNGRHRSNPHTFWWQLPGHVSRRSFRANSIAVTRKWRCPPKRQ